MSDNNTLNHPESEQELDALETGQVRTEKANTTEPNQTDEDGNVVPSPDTEKKEEEAAEAAPSSDEAAA